MRLVGYCFRTLILLLGAGAVQASEPASQAAPSSAAAAADAIPLPDPQANSYIIGPGDVLQVFVWRNPELSASIPVRPDGKISTPLVEDMVATGKTPSNLARDIEAVLGEYIRSPQVNIIVSQSVSTFSQVRVIGEVRSPQAVPFRQGMTVLDVVLAVGGLGDFASGNRARIVRSEDGKQREIRVRLADLVNKGDMRQNVALVPGDVLVVPQSMF